MAQPARISIQLIAHLATLQQGDRLQQIALAKGLALLPPAGTSTLLKTGMLCSRPIEGWRATGGYLNLPYLKCALAEAVSRQGDVERGLRLLDECLDQIERPGWHERVWLAEILRVKGSVFMRQGRRTEAEAQLRASIECARQQQARSWELRSSTTLAQLFIECAEHDAARQLIAPIYGWFTEGFDTRDLKAAKALLEELA
jgi:predicted ATPase